MSRPPLVSCLLGTYNFAPFLARSIESVLAQDYPADRMQIIVVDDGSTDETPSVVEPYLDRVTYIRKPNGGLRSTVNRLLEEARGELITFQSGDDVWFPERLSLQVAQMQERPELGLVYADMRVIDADDNTLAESFWALNGIAPVRGRALGSLLHRNVVSGGTLMVRASLRAHFAPLPDFAPWEDWWIALAVARVAEIDYLEVPVFGYRRHANNMNLGADAARGIELAAAELPLRRWMLTDLDSDEVTAPEWLVAYQDWASALAYVAAGQGQDLDQLVPASSRGVDAAAAAALEAGEQLAAGDLRSAARAVVRALGRDPFSAPAQQALTAVAAAVGGGAEPGEEYEVRDFVTLAEAEELIEEPGLLRAYGAAFGGGDDASLVVLVCEERIPALSAVIEQAGLGGDGGPDVVGVPVVAGAGFGAAGAIAPWTHAVLSRRPPHGPLAIHPHVEDRGIERLRELAERRWAREG